MENKRRNLFARVVSMMLAAVLVCGCVAMTGTVAAEDSLPFTDVPESKWFHDDVVAMYDSGIMAGIDDTTFAPYQKASRAMMVAMLYRLEGSPEVGQCRFEDVPADAYYADAVTWAYTNGIVFGITEERFGPNFGLSRQQFATLMYRYAFYKNGKTVFDGDSTNGYWDANDIAPYAKMSMTWAVSRDVIEGVSDDLLAPREIATRAQVAAILNRFINEIL